MHCLYWMAQPHPQNKMTKLAKIAMDWQVARQLEIRVQDVVMQVGFTESKDVRSLLEHKYFKIYEISPQTSYIGVVDSKRWR